MTAELLVIKKHSTPKIHTRNVRSIGSLQPLIKGFVNNQTKLNELQKIKKAELLLNRLLSEFNLSFNVIDYITAIYNVAFDDSKIASGINLGNTKATSIVNNFIVLLASRWRDNVKNQAAGSGIELGPLACRTIALPLSYPTTETFDIITI
ncbi:uncharacterized protein LOC112682244 [Sipha flava]|uniref:Uncharacterized protein LOC112682244 n=1 Tax=Sipha flava TaxID=143950 RepID=A0A8B8FDN2_9HEMI|nr:uncharacterized protein LOC112682244 [Sipha flava]